MQRVTAGARRAGADFGAGAMENWGLVLYRETDLLAGNASGIEQRRDVALTVAHELAHMVRALAAPDRAGCAWPRGFRGSKNNISPRISAMGVPGARAQWFGDLVTMGAWGELWLNEGFATYLETLGASAAAPDLALLAGFFPDITAVGLAADARNLSTHSLSQAGGARPGASWRLLPTVVAALWLRDSNDLFAAGWTTTVESLL